MYRTFAKRYTGKTSSRVYRINTDYCGFFKFNARIFYRKIRIGN